MSGPRFVRLSSRQSLALRAVAAGGVTHLHPLTFVLDLPYLAVSQRSLERKKLIRVEAGSRERFRPVALTPAGAQAVGGENPRGEH